MLDHESEPIRQKREQSKTKEYIIIGVLALLLAGSLIYNFVQRDANPQEVSQLRDSLRGNESVRNSLQEDLNTLKQEYETAKLQMEKPDATSGKQDSIIAAHQAEIQKILNKSNATEKELTQARTLIASLRTQVSDFQSRITMLTRRNDSLNSQNKKLYVRQTQLTDSLSQSRAETKKKQETIQSTFAISNYQIQGIKVRRNGKEKEKDRASAVNLLRVSFDVDPNSMVEPGEKEIYVAIYKPNGQIGKFDNADGGLMTTNSYGSIAYSDRVKFNYQPGTRQRISFDWRDESFQRGDYKVALYQNGFKIGVASLTLR